MANEIQICNFALSHIGASSISSFNESSKEAIECNRLYEYERDSVLRDHRWNFAVKQETLALLTEEYLGWEFAYSYPIDCLAIHKIYNEYDSTVNRYNGCYNYQYYPMGNIQYEVRANNSLSSRIILTNEEDAKVIYTAKITTPNLFDPIFIETLSWKLAADLAQPVRGDLQLQQFCEQKYALLLTKAMSKDSNEGYEIPVDSNSYINSRL